MPYRNRANVTLGWLTAGLLAAVSGMAQALDIQVVLHGAKPETAGEVYAALVPVTAQAWRAKPQQTLQSAARLLFTNVPPGEYAVQLFVDVNGNRQLDVSPRGIPREPVGFSNNPSLLKGEPKIEAAAFTLGDQPLQLNIRLRQPPRVAGHTPTAITH